LTGPILSQEKGALLAAVKHVRGVARVDDSLDLYKAEDNVPSPQGQRRSELLQTRWTPALRLSSLGAATALAAYGLRRRGGLGLIATGCGAALALRAVANLPILNAIGIGAGPYVIEVHKTISVKAPIEQTFALLSNLERLPRFMDHVSAVRVADGRSRWKVRGPAAVPVSFEATLTQFVPNRMLAWRTNRGFAVRHEGAIHFEQQPDGKTRLDVRLSYSPMAGLLGHALAKMFGVDPKRALDEDLVRLKSQLEAGETMAHNQRMRRDDVSRDDVLPEGPG